MERDESLSLTVPERPCRRGRRNPIRSPVGLVVPWHAKIKTAGGVHLPAPPAGRVTKRVEKGVCKCDKKISQGMLRPSPPSARITNRTRHIRTWHPVSFVVSVVRTPACLENEPRLIARPAEWNKHAEAEIAPSLTKKSARTFDAPRARNNIPI